MNEPSEAMNFHQLLPVLFVTFIDSMGLTIVIPILPFYVLAFDAPPAIVGLLIMSYSLAQFIFAPILGRLSDRFGRKPILALAQVGTFSSLLLLGVAWALPVIFIARILDGVTGANLSTVQSAVSDMTNSKTRARGLGLIGAAFGLGFVVGPLLGGVALRLGNNNYSAPAFVAAGFAFLSIMLTTFVFQETLPSEAREADPSRRSSVQRLLDGLRSPDLGPLYGFVFAAQGVLGVFISSFALYTLNRLGFNSVNNSLFFGMFGMVQVLVQGVFVGRWVPRFGEFRLLVASFIITSIGYGVASLTPQQAVPWYSEAALVEELSQEGGGRAQIALLPNEEDKGVTALVILSIGLLGVPIGYSLQLPVLNTLLTKRVNPADIGQTLGTSAAFLGAGTVVGPVLGGWLFDQIAPWAPFAVNAGLSVVLLFLLLLLRSTFVVQQSKPPTVAAAGGFD